MARRAKVGLFADVPGVLAVSVECPKCCARVDEGCGACHAYGSHRQRIRAALVHAGRPVWKFKVHVPDAHPFFLNTKTLRYFDRVPGYRQLFVEREWSSQHVAMLARAERAEANVTGLTEQLRRTIAERDEANRMQRVVEAARVIAWRDRREPNVRNTKEDYDALRSALADLEGE